MQVSAKFTFIFIFLEKSLLRLPTNAHVACREIYICVANSRKEENSHFVYEIEKKKRKERKIFAVRDRFDFENCVLWQNSKAIGVAIKKNRRSQLMSDVDVERKEE